MTSVSKTFIILKLLTILAFNTYSWVWGPYSKLWTEFFPSFYGPSAKHEGHENKEGKNKDP